MAVNVISVSKIPALPCLGISCNVLVWNTSWATAVVPSKVLTTSTNIVNVLQDILVCTVKPSLLCVPLGIICAFMVVLVLVMKTSARATKKTMLLPWVVCIVNIRLLQNVAKIGVLMTENARMASLAIVLKGGTDPFARVLMRRPTKMRNLFCLPPLHSRKNQMYKIPPPLLIPIRLPLVEHSP